MGEMADRYDAVTAGFARRLERVTDEQWDLPTTCPDWTVRDLVVHTVTTQRMVAARLTDSEPAPVDAHGDLAAQWRDAVEEIRQLDPAAVEAATEFLTPIDEAIRRPGGFGAKLMPPPDADEQTRFLAFCGRAA